MTALETWGLGERTKAYLQTPQGQRAARAGVEPWMPNAAEILADAYGNYLDRLLTGSQVVGEAATEGVKAVAKTVGESLTLAIPKPIWALIIIGGIAAIAIWATSKSGGIAALKGS